HAYDTTTSTWACWGEAPLTLDAGIGIDIDADTAMIFGVEPKAEGEGEGEGEREKERETLCYRVKIGRKREDPVNLLLETPAKREAQ
ncbi:hypothetical protein KIPB_015714, partial [Kipferlia bialata]